MKDPANVAVIIAGYRSESLIARAIRSALVQPETAEVVVVVDASPDATAARARTADDGSGRLTVTELQTNQGPAAARNIAIGTSKAPWICILDDDDFMEPGRLGRLLENASTYDFVADDLELVQEGDESGTRTPMWFKSEATARELNLETFVAGNVPHPTYRRQQLGYLKPLMSRQFLQKHGLRYDVTMRLGEDYDLYARALAAGARFLLMPAQGYVSVLRTTSLSRNHSAEDLLALRMADDRLLGSASLSRAERAAIKAHRLSTDKAYQWRRLIDAVKSKDIRASARCFLSDTRTSAHLIEKLWEQFLLRAFRQRSLRLGNWQDSQAAGSSWRNVR